MTLGVFVTSTVAWFDISNNLIVNNLDISFSDDQSIKVAFSKDGEQYTTAGPDILEKETNYRSSMGLQPVTSAFQKEWLNGTTVFDNTLPVLRSSPADGDKVAKEGFIQFPLYIVTPQDGYVYLDSSTSFLSDTAANAVTARKLKLNEDDLNKVGRSVRASFYSDDFGFKIYEPNVASSSMTKLGGRLDLNPFDGYFDYDPSSNKEIMFGEFNASDNPTLVYGLAKTEDTPFEGEWTCFNSGTKAGIAPLDIESSFNAKTNPLVIAQEKTLTLSDMLAPEDGQPGGNPITYCYAGVPHKIILSIYAEGWDLDTVSSISNSSLKMNVGFTAMYAPKITN